MSNEREDKVLAVLAESSEPIGPTEIARRINEGWCCDGGYPQSAAIVPILRRIGATRIGNGKYALAK